MTDAPVPVRNDSPTKAIATGRVPLRLLKRITEGVNSRRNHLISGGLRHGKTTILEALHNYLREQGTASIRMNALVFEQQLESMFEDDSPTDHRDRQSPAFAARFEQWALEMREGGEGPPADKGPIAAILLDDIDQILPLRWRNSPRAGEQEPVFEKLLSAGLFADGRFPAVLTSRFTRDQLASLTRQMTLVSSWVTDLHPVEIDPWNPGWNKRIARSLGGALDPLVSRGRTPEQAHKLAKSLITHAVSGTGGHPALVEAVLDRLEAVDMQTELEAGPYPKAYLAHVIDEAIIRNAGLIAQRVMDILDRGRVSPGVELPDKRRKALRALVSQLVVGGKTPLIDVDFEDLPFLEYLGITRLEYQGDVGHRVVSPAIAHRLDRALTPTEPPTSAALLRIRIEVEPDGEQGTIIAMPGGGREPISKSYSGKIWTVLHALARRGRQLTPPGELGATSADEQYARTAISRVNRDFEGLGERLIENEYRTGYRFAAPVDLGGSE